MPKSNYLLATHWTKRASEELAASYIILWPYFKNKTPSGCQQSCQRWMFLPEPTSNLMKGLAISLSFRIFLHPQLQSWGILIIQKLLPLTRLVLTHATHNEPDWNNGLFKLKISNGTPRYLNWRNSRICCFKCARTEARKISLIIFKL